MNKKITDNYSLNQPLLKKPEIQSEQASLEFFNPVENDSLEKKNFLDMNFFH